MAWERGYYYRVRKVNGGVVREYVGTGEVAELVAQMDALERERRRLETLEQSQEKDELKALDARLKAMSERTELAARAALLAAGFTSTSAANGEDDVSKPTTAAQASPKKHDELLALTDRAQKGDKTALPALRELLKEPAAADLLGGDLAKQAQLTLINKFSGQNLLFRESLTRKLDLLREELAGPNPTPLERLLVERIVACWLPRRAGFAVPS
jgi:hypothetical protein